MVRDLVPVLDEPKDWPPNGSRWQSRMKNVRKRVVKLPHGICLRLSTRFTPVGYQAVVGRCSLRHRFTPGRCQLRAPRERVQGRGSSGMGAAL